MIPDSVLLVRASWPSMVCAVSGLHAWDARIAALVCSECGEHLLYEDCRAYQRWETWWQTELRSTALAPWNPVARLN